MFDPGQKRRTRFAFGLQVVVLEARERIGGRVWDDTTLGVTVGRGAQIVNGCVNNPVALMCEQVGISALRHCRAASPATKRVEEGKETAGRSRLLSLHGGHQETSCTGRFK